MTNQLSESAVQAWAGLLRAQQVLLERVEGELKRADLPPLGWYDVLLELSRTEDGRLRQFEIGDKVLLSKHNLSRLLDRLEDEGLVKREVCREDRRGAHVAITRAGRALLKKMWPVYERAIAEYFARRLSSEEAEQLAALMRRFTAQPP
jgi:DNA-binding MarR family transcriptional regulator